MVLSCSTVSMGMGEAVAAVLQEGWREFTPSRKCCQYCLPGVSSPSRICQGLAVEVVAVTVAGADVEVVRLVVVRGVSELLPADVAVVAVGAATMTGVGLAVVEVAEAGALFFLILSLSSLSFLSFLLCSSLSFSLSFSFLSFLSFSCANFSSSFLALAIWPLSLSSCFLTSS